MKNLSTKLATTLALALIAMSASAVTTYQYQVYSKGVVSPVQAVPAPYVIADTQLLTPANAPFYEGKHPVWVNTGHPWMGVVTGYVSTAPVGDGNYETLIVNNTASAMSISIPSAADDRVTGVKLGNISMPLPACVTQQASAVCTLGPYSIPANVTLRLNVNINNSGTTASPGGVSMWVINTGTGAILRDTANPSDWRWTSTPF